jgi:nitrogen-specific signal transduction histidine kinase
MSRTLEELIHDVKSKCSSLKGAAELLRGSSAPKVSELLPLMIEQARSLTKCLEDFKQPGR